jgi:hypothetical protein
MPPNTTLNTPQVLTHLQGMDKIKETKKLRNRICVGYTETTSVDAMFFYFFPLFSDCISVLVIVLSDSLCERTEIWEICLIFK